MDGELGYDASRISSSGADCLAHSLETILKSALEKPDRAVRDLALLDPDSRRAILLRSQGPAQPVPGKTLHSLFEDQARLTPNQIAVADEAAQLTFRELDAAADSIATDLRAHACPDALIRPDR